MFSIERRVFYQMLGWGILLFLLFLIYDYHFPVEFDPQVKQERIEIHNLIKQLGDRNPMKRKEAADLLGRMIPGTCVQTPSSIAMDRDELLIVISLKKLIKVEQVNSVRREALNSLFLYGVYNNVKLDYLWVFKEFLSCPDGAAICDRKDDGFCMIPKIFDIIDERNDKDYAKNFFLILNNAIKNASDDKKRNQIAGILLETWGHNIQRFHTEYPIDIIKEVVFKNQSYYFKNTRLLRDIGEFKIKEGFDILIMALKNDDYEIRSEAALNIGFLGDIKAIPYLVDSLKIHGVEEINIVLALGILDVKEALPIIVEKIKLLNNSIDSVRAEWIAAAIDKLDREEGLKQLQLLLEDENEYVRMNVKEIIEKITNRDFSTYLNNSRLGWYGK